LTNQQQQQQPKNCAQPTKEIRDEIDGGICFGLFGFLCRMSRRSHLNPFFWNVFTLLTNGYDHFLHCERILIMSKSLLELSFQVSMICYQFSQIVFSFYCLLTIFPLFYLSLIQLLPQFATWFSLDLIASTCHLSVLIIYLWNASHKKKRNHNNTKNFNDYYLLLQLCTEIYLYTL